MTVRQEDRTAENRPALKSNRTVVLRRHVGTRQDAAPTNDLMPCEKCVFPSFGVASALPPGRAGFGPPTSIVHAGGGPGFFIAAAGRVCP